MIRIESRVEAESVTRQLANRLSASKFKAKMRAAGKFAVKDIPKQIKSDVKDVFGYDFGSHGNVSNRYQKAKSDSFWGDVAVQLTGKRLPLYFFKHSPNHATRRGDPLVRVEIVRGPPRTYDDHTFIATIRGKSMQKHGNYGDQIWQRTSSHRFPVRALKGPSYPEMATKTEIRNRALETMMRRYVAELEKSL